MTYNEFIQDIINTRGQWNIPAGQYFEMHHILPLCLGGAGDSKTGRFKSKSKHENCIWLYPKEHFIAHKLLAIENLDNYKLMYAWKQMWLINDRQERYEPLAEEYEEYKLYSNQLKSRYKHSAKTKQLISKNNKGKHNIPLSEKQKKYLSEINTGELNPNYGLKRSEETRTKISVANKGKTASDETKLKLSESHKGNTSALGHRLSEETKKIIGDKSRGRVTSEETCKKLSNNLLGNTRTKGRKWFNNGIISKMFFPDAVPDGFIPGRVAW